MKKIVFINPCRRENVFQSVKHMRKKAAPPNNLGILAALTPDRYEINILDETLEPLQFESDADLVALTAMTSLAPHVYEIASRYREMGVPVILGGIHASLETEEALKYVDSVVIGEAEEAWPAVLDDFERGELKRTYTPPLPTGEQMIPPRRDLFDEAYFLHAVQTSRGCPFNCKFCSVTRFNGTKHRFRPVEDVIAEVASLKQSSFMMLDDNLIGSNAKSIANALKLFQGMRGLKKKWGAQMCIDVVEHDDLLSAIAAAGGSFMFLGFESLESETLKGMNKKINLRSTTRDFKAAIRKIHDHGIAAMGGFIFGNDGDTKDVFKKTTDFILESGLDGCELTLLTPFPGTKVFEQLKEENRLTYTNFPKDWAHYNGFEVVYRPQNMTAEELLEGQIWAYQQVGSLNQSLRRAMKTLLTTRNLLSTALSFSFTYELRKTVSKRNEVTIN